MASIKLYAKDEDLFTNASFPISRKKNVATVYKGSGLKPGKIHPLVHSINLE